MSLDETDIRILEQLEQNGRASLRELAERLDLSPSTVSNRFHALQDSGVIQGFRPVLDHEQLGFGLTAVIEIKADASLVGAVADRVREADSVLSAFEVTGDTDIVIVCAFLDREDMNGFVKELQQDEGVEETKTNVVLTPPKVWGRVDLDRARRTLD